LTFSEKDPAKYRDFLPKTRDSLRLQSHRNCEKSQKLANEEETTYRTIKFKRVNTKMDSLEQSTTLPALPNDDLTPLEQDVLEEYERLAENMKKVH